jgi:hypothetical protein
VLTSKPDTWIFTHAFPECFKVLSAIPRPNRLVGKRSVTREYVVLPVCRHKFQGLAVRRGEIVIGELGVIQLKVMVKNSVIPL